MGILAQSVARKASDDGSIRSSLDLFRLLVGGWKTASGKDVTHKNALEVSTVLAATRVLAEGIAQVPFRLMRDDGTNKLPAKDHPLYRLLYLKPNGWMSSYELRETMAIHAILTGDALAFVNRDMRGNVREIIPIVPGAWSVEQQSDYSLLYRITAPNNRSEVFPQAAIWHWRGPSWNSVEGLDVVKLAREAIGLAMATETAQSRIQQNGGALGGVYSVEGTLDEVQYKQLRKFLAENFDGATNAIRTKLLDRSAKFYPSSMTSVDAQQLETRRNQVEEICRALRVLPIMVGHSDKTTTYASAEQMFIAHVVHHLGPWYQRIEQSAMCQLLTEKDLDGGMFAKFFPAGLMRGAHKDRADFYAKALGSGGSIGWMVPDEVRDLEDMNPLGGIAAELPLPSNMATSPDAESGEDDGKKPEDDEDGKPDL